jgi:uncharacterized paraquat-inducible protein A
LPSVATMECKHCSYPNPYLRPRCLRCGASLHSLRERIMVPLVVAVVAVAVALVFLRP